MRFNTGNSYVYDKPRSERWKMHYTDILFWKFRRWYDKVKKNDFVAENLLDPAVSLFSLYLLSLNCK